MIGLTKSLALELGPVGITVNTIPPGSVDTPMSRRAADEGRFGGGFRNEERRKTDPNWRYVWLIAIGSIPIGIVALILFVVFLIGLGRRATPRTPNTPA